MWGDLPAAELILNVTDYEANKEGTDHNHSNSEERDHQEQRLPTKDAFKGWILSIIDQL